MKNYILPSKRISEILEGIKKGEITSFKDVKDDVTVAIILFLNEEHNRNSHCDCQRSMLKK